MDVQSLIELLEPYKDKQMVYVDYYKGRNGNYIDGASVNYDEYVLIDTENKIALWGCVEYGESYGKQEKRQGYYKNGERLL